MFDMDHAIKKASKACRNLFPKEQALEKVLVHLESKEPSAEKKARLLVLLGMVTGQVFIGPQSLLLDIVGTCNLNCIFCRDHSPMINNRENWRDMEMPFELASRLMDQGADLGVSLILLLGAGEPLLHSRYPDLVKQVKALPVKFETFTNGLLMDGKLGDLFLDAHRGRVHFSVSAANEEIYRKFRPHMPKGLYPKIEKSIRYLTQNREPGLKVILVHVINNMNFDQVIPMIERAIDLGVDEVQYKMTELNEIGPSLKLSSEQVHSLELEMKHVRHLAAKAGVDVHDNIDFQFENYNPQSGNYAENLYDDMGCNMGWELVRVRRDGEVSFCCGLKFIDNISNKSLVDYWRGPYLEKARNIAKGFFKGKNMKLPDGQMLRDSQCDYCYNYISNFHTRDELDQLGLLPLIEKMI